MYGESLGHSVVDLSSFLNVIYLSTSNFAISLSAGITIDFGEKREKKNLWKYAVFQVLILILFAAYWIYNSVEYFLLC